MYTPLPGQQKAAKDNPANITNQPIEQPIQDPSTSNHQTVQKSNTNAKANEPEVDHSDTPEVHNPPVTPVILNTNSVVALMGPNSRSRLEQYMAIYEWGNSLTTNFSNLSPNILCST